MELKTLRILLRDHINQGELLDLIESELCRNAVSASSPDFELIVLALEYCVDYPEHYHHPAEDAVYARLLQRKPALRGRLVEIDRDHKLLSALTNALAVAISKAIEGGPVNAVSDTGARFVEHYRRHMKIEEAEIFPAAREHLNAADWDAVEAAIAIPKDPLFDEHIREAYHGLQRRIVQQRQKNAG